MQQNAARSGILLFSHEGRLAGLAVFGLDPNDVVFVHKQDGLGPVFSLNIREDDEGVFGLGEKIRYPGLDADVDFSFPGDTVRGFDTNPSVFLFINVFALLQAAQPPSIKIPAQDNPAGRDASAF